VDHLARFCSSVLRERSARRSAWRDQIGFAEAARWQFVARVCAPMAKKSPSTWYHLVRKFGWRRPRLRMHPAKPKVGLRTTRANEMWHVDTTVIRLLDGTRAYLHAVIDNFSRRILAWRVVEALLNRRGRPVHCSHATRRTHRDKT